MSLPAVYRAPDGKGSAIHPLLLALYYSAPSLVKAVAASNTDEGTLSKAVKQAWSSLAAQDNPTAKPVWDLIGEDKLIPVDSTELFAQMCDLFDGELKDAAANALGVSTKMVIESGARVKDGKPHNGYHLPLSIPVRGMAGGFKLSTLFDSNFATEKIDYMFPDDVEPVSSEKYTRITGRLHECFVVHLQRYKYDLGTMSNSKLYDRVEVPQSLTGADLAKHADVDAAKMVSNCSLELVAVVTHSDEKGYGLLLRPEAKGTWFRCCDADTHDVPMETSLESVFGGELESDVAYLLFYKVTGEGGALASLARKMSRASMRGQPVAAKAAPTSAAGAATTAESAAKSGGGCCSVQ